MALIDCDPNEDHEKYMGPEIPDPWSDPKQTDWTMNEEVGNVDVGPNQGDEHPQG